MANGIPVVLTIAGFDPCSGAGVTADIKTIAANGCYAVSCITALTVQSTTGVTEMQPVSAALVRATLSELARDVEIAAIRIGMLGSGEVVEAVAEFLRGAENDARLRHVVLDPIFKSSNGADLLEPGAIDTLRDLLLPLATVITPNVDEAVALSGLPVGTMLEMKKAAQKLHELGARNVVVTGGDISGGHPEKAVDLLSMAQPHDNASAPANGNGKPLQTQFASDRVRTSSTHGTGCAFASALAANLALGKQLPDAVVLAKAYVKKAMASAHPLGKGNGPLNHLYRLEEPHRPAHEPVMASKEG